ncbi:hypothetical protein Clacol_004010 [Clathrus columnatus]|uniref:Uncharacterized protein n=1 Tax=Clathrus columnatus TaxID=1419009 RepID=A0AAV5ABD3_9AGAM|nr:hypothetical protein Clacol_004010 [Clathrus columnatus]
MCGSTSVPVNLSFTSPITVDLEMLDTNVLENRPSLPTSLSDFALFPSSSASAPSSPSASSSADDSVNPFFRRLRRSSLLSASLITSHAHPDGKPASPLAASFTPRAKRSLLSVDSEKLQVTTDTTNVSSSEKTLKLPSFSFSEPLPSTSKLVDFHLGQSQSSTPSTPDNNLSRAGRRASIPLKPPRLLDIKSELNSPIESELKSEAQFQRLVASYSNTNFPFNKNVPRTPRSWFDRGRYPEEANVGDDNIDQGAESGSDDDDDIAAPGSAHSVSMTPVGSGASASGGLGEDQMMTLDTNFNNGFLMDIDMQPLSAISSPTQWRETPPPTSCRSNKRKFDDRYDPYPIAAKRRAVSPAVHVHHHHHGRSGSMSHSPAIPIPIPRTARSVTSSPVMRPASSPTMRPSSFGHSPTLRPIARLPPLASLRGGSDSEKEREKTRRCIDGAEEAVGSLSLTE